MHVRHRLLVSLLAGVAAVSLGFATYQAIGEMHTLRDDLQRQALVLAESQQRPAAQALESLSPSDRQAFVDQFKNHERLAGVGLFDRQGIELAATSGIGQSPVVSRAVKDAIATGRAHGEFFRAAFKPMHIMALPVVFEGEPIGVIAFFHNVAYTGAPVLRHALTSIAQTLLIVGLTFLIVRWSVGKPLHRMTQWLRDLHTGKPSSYSELPEEDIFQPLASEVTRLATSLKKARDAAQEEARLRDAAQSNWTAEMLRISVQSKLNGSRLFALSNREPYEHFYENGSLKWAVPPSGLVTALEPVLRACDGLWIAQGTGSADHDTADSGGRLRVPPDHPQYTLRRVWLSRQEEEGFYFGFANEGLWPLCHIAHTRPLFRSEDWEQYRTVNQKFADALIDEMAGEKNPLVLAQDYHFALLPRMIKEKRPDARVAIFWHIPWPNPEAFGICPWQRELLHGMLGADLIGFHIQEHCNNFLDTIDRTLESRIDWGHFTVNRQDQLTAVRPFPISVAFDTGSSITTRERLQERRDLLGELGVDATYIGLGVDRVDYTKGIPERFRGIERLLERHPSYQGKLVFIQIGAPSRTRIKRYQDLMAEVRHEADRINRRFRSGFWKPIVFLERHHSHSEIQRYYRAADFFEVTSLHDGMNLVAKEFIAARDDESGSLILSRFTGARHELADALIVNPYDTDELAEAVHTALTMSAPEKTARMRRMRAVIREHNVYRWAGSLIAELAKVRLEQPPAGAAPEEAAEETAWYAPLSRGQRAAHL